MSTILRHRLGRDLRDGASVVGIAFVATLVITGVVAVFADVRISGWDLTTQLARWYAGGLGVYLTAVYLPLYIAHGHTRRAFLTQLPLASLASTLLLGGLVAVGYLVEHLLYRGFGWDQELTQEHLFRSTTQVGLVFAESSLLFLVYLVGGTLAGAVFYRYRGIGLLLVPVLLVVAGLNEAITGSVRIPFVVDWAGAVGIPLDPPTLAVAGAVSLTSAVVMGLATWVVSRNLPVRTPTT